MISKYEKVKKDFFAGRIKGCKTYFESNGYYLEAGYCYLVLDKLDKAQEMFLKAKSENIRANWGLFLIQLIKGDIKSSPTYFEIRNFLELDIDILITYCKGDYIEKIIRYADFMAHYNPECHKFLGRVFWANNFLPAAMFYLNKAKDEFYLDPELHYLYGYIYYTEKNFMQCKKSLDECIRILPEYAPANALMKKLKEKI